MSRLARNKKSKNVVEHLSQKGGGMTPGGVFVLLSMVLLVVLIIRMAF